MKKIASLICIAALFSGCAKQDPAPVTPPGPVVGSPTGPHRYNPDGSVVDCTDPKSGDAIGGPCAASGQ